MYFFRLGLAAALACAWLEGAVAAPLDVFLTAHPEPLAASAQIELSADRMNTQLDVFDLRSRSNNPDNADGSYSANRVSGGMKVGDAVWVSGSLAQRVNADSGGTYRFVSWSAAGQYRFNAQDAWLPATALRLSAWGNFADQTESTKSVLVPGAKLDSIKITSPADQQLQADLIGSWTLSPQTEVSAMVSAGRSQLSYSALAATTTLDSCQYKIRFTGNAIYGVLAAPCASDIYIKEIYDNSGRLGIDVAKELAWHGNYVQAGVTARWQQGPWAVRGGYVFYTVERDSIDAILLARKQTSFTQSHTLGLETSYRIVPAMQLAVSVLLNSNLFFSDMPVNYNTGTAARFDSATSIFGLSLRYDF